jgi:hypothetical protein
VTAVGIEQVEAALLPPRNELGAISREQRLSHIEDYLYINGARLTERQAAERLGLTVRTIQRYRAILRTVTGTPPPSRSQSGRRGACTRYHHRDCVCWQTGAVA